MVKIKICYFIPSLWNAGGMERILTIKANYLVQKLGYEVTIVMTNQKNKDPFFELDKSIRLINIPSTSVTDSKEKSLVERLFRNNNKSEYKIFVKNLLERETYDFCISMMGGAEFGFLPTIKDKSIKIAELHFSIGYNKLMSSNILEKIYHYIVEQKFYFYARRYAKVVVLTKKDKENLIQYVRNTIVIPNPITVTPETLANNDNKVIIFVGRFEFEKGVDLLLNIWEIVTKQIEGWELRIFGSGSEESEIKKAIYAKKLSHITINHPTSNISAEYEKASIFVMTSRSEGFPLSLLESMAFGIAPISFDCPNGPKEIIGEKTNGILIENGNIKSFAEKLVDLIQDNDYRKEISTNARKRAAVFSVPEVMGKWIKLFNDTRL